MKSEWAKLEGKLTFEEKSLVNHICETGLQSTKSLLLKTTQTTTRAQTEGAILAFEILVDANLRTFKDYIDQWDKFEERCRTYRDREKANNKDILAYWKIRGQQLQIQFILDRLLAYRAMTNQIHDVSLSSMAVEYVGRWMNSLEY